MNELYTISITGKDISLLCDAITERINSNNEISRYTGQNLSHKNRSLNRLHRYLRSFKSDSDYEQQRLLREQKKQLKKQRKEIKKNGECSRVESNRC